MVNPSQNLLVIFNKKDLINTEHLREIKSKIPHYLSLLKQKTPFDKIDRHFGSAENKEDIEKLKQKLLKVTTN